MLRNNLKIALRNLLRHKAFSFINIFGLGLGMAAFIFILQYVSFEFSYDSFHQNSGRIYRVARTYYEGTTVEGYAENNAATGPALKAEFPEVASYARLVYSERIRGNYIVGYKDKKFSESRIYYADASFLPMFSFPFFEGDAIHALKDPFSAVISRSTAKKFFGAGSALNKIITVNGNEQFVVKGVFEDVPDNSHIKFDYLLSFNSLPREWNLDNHWDWGNFYTYILLDEKSQVKSLESKLPGFIEKYLGKYFDEGVREVYHLQQLKDIHLNSDLRHEAEPNGNSKLVYFLIVIALFILGIAWFNYINLSTVKALQRAKEIGVRKILGSSKAQLIRQFLTESILLNILAIVLAITIVQLSQPLFNWITGKNLSVGWIFNDTFFWTVALAFFISGAILSGIYPALLLSSYKPMVAIKGLIKIGKGDGLVLRKSLVVLQFAASVILIAGTLAVQKQLQFMRNQELGFNNQVLVLKSRGVTDSTFAGREEAFINEIKKMNFVKDIALCSSVPGKEITWARGIALSGHETKEIETKVVGIDTGFIKTFDVKLLAGRNFSEKFKSDMEGALLNQAAVKSLGFLDPSEVINKKISYEDRHLTILGVVKDFHQQSLKIAKEPMIFRLNARIQFYALVLRQDKKENALSASLQQLEAGWKKNFPDNPFEYFFLDDQFNRQYNDDQRFGSVIGLFSSLAIFIACLGLLGLASFTATQKTKEIGVRKVLGASVTNILNLLTSDLMKMILIANVLSLPLIYFGLKKWLQGYAYQTELSWWVFIVPPLLIIIVSILSVSFQTIKAAVGNPVKALRYE